MSRVRVEMAVSTALHNVQSKDRDDRESNIGNVVDFESGTSLLLNVGEKQVLASGKKLNEASGELGLDREANLYSEVSIASKVKPSKYADKNGLIVKENLIVFYTSYTDHGQRLRAAEERFSAYIDRLHLLQNAYEADLAAWVPQQQQWEWDLLRTNITNPSTIWPNRTDPALPQHYSRENALLSIE
ncbi:hypothetical protein DTO195F2_8737 [Paecilomyces variotii]|nr:hypothetical protein DTO195F2_8737 [Paecilomyces variotii]